MHREQAARKLAGLGLSIRQPGSNPYLAFAASAEAAWWWLVVLMVVYAALAWSGRLMRPTAPIGGMTVAIAMLLAHGIRRLGAGHLAKRVWISAALLPPVAWCSWVGAGISLMSGTISLACIVAAESLWWLRISTRCARWLTPRLAVHADFPSVGSRLRVTDTGAGEVVSEVTRFLKDDCETVAARWELHYTVGTQRLVLHLPICPPLASPPEVDAQWDGDLPGTCRITQIEIYGVRAEVRFALPAAHSGSGRLLLWLRAPLAATRQPNSL